MKLGYINLMARILPHRLNNNYNKIKRMAHVSSLGHHNWLIQCFLKVQKKRFEVLLLLYPYLKKYKNMENLFQVG